MLSSTSINLHPSDAAPIPTSEEVEVRRTAAYPIRYDAFDTEGVLFIRSEDAPVIGSEFGYFAENIPSPHYNFKCAGLYVEIIEYPHDKRTVGKLRVEVQAERPDRTRTQVIHAETFEPGEAARAIEYAVAKIKAMRAWLAGGAT